MLTILQGDAIARLRELPSESVHCCVTSPPYWGLRDYSADGQLGLEKTPDCGRPLAKLIGGLTSSQVAFVRQRLKDAGLLDAFPDGMGGTRLRRSPLRSEVLDARPTVSNDEPEAYRHAYDNPDIASHRVSEQRHGTGDTPESYSLFREQENDRPSNSDVELRPDENFVEAGIQHGEPHGQSPIAIPSVTSYPKERDLSTAQLSSEHFGSSVGIVDSQSLQERKSLHEHQDASQDCPEHSAKSSDKSSRKSKYRVQSIPDDIGDKLWAWYSLPQDVIKFYESQLCSECYVCKMVEVFSEVRRVLRKDGTLWLNLGDSYASGELGRHDRSNGYEGEFQSATRQGERARAKLQTGLKPKDLCGIPWRVAFALQADGWWLRSDIIWAKPNPMPESVTDRPTKAHEYLFLLTRSANYYYDAEAIREPHQEPWRSGTSENRLMAKGTDGYKATFGGWDYDERIYNPAGRNKRSVWTVATAPYPEAHFATYPPDLIKPCILAGTSAKGCCAKCGAPWERVVEREVVAVSDSPRYSGVSMRNDSDDGRTERSTKTLGWQPTCKHFDPSPGGGGTSFRGHSGHLKDDGTPIVTPKITTGWTETCGCESGIAPCTVLDPFAGSGTTGSVALELGRKAILIELNPQYIQMIRDRCNITPGLALA